MDLCVIAGLSDRVFCYCESGLDSMDEELVLTPDQIFKITGYKQKKKQKSQLAAMGIPFGVDAADKPVVMPEAVRSVLCVSAGSPKSSVRVRPNFFDVKSDGRRKGNDAKKEEK